MNAAIRDVTAAQVSRSLDQQPPPPAGAIGKTLRDRLRGIEGFDPDLALRNLHGQHAMLMRVLRRFATTYRDGVPVLLDTAGVEHELIARWRLICHSLRGALATIGARALCAQVIELERELCAFESRASLIANARRLHANIIEFSQRLTIELAATVPSAVPGLASRGGGGRSDPGRLSQLRRLLVLDTAPEPAFDEIASRMARHFGMQIAIVNLLDDDRDWFKSCVGLDLRESPSTGSFCEAFFYTQDDVIVVEDMLTDPRYVRHPFVVGAPFVRSYAAARLVVEGFTVGTLCAYGSKRRCTSAGDVATLQALASAVVELLV